MKRIFVISVAFVFIVDVYSQITSNQMEYTSSQFEMNYVQPLIGDTLIAPQMVMIKKGSNEFRLDSTNCKIYIIKQLHFTVYKSNKYDFIYSGNEIVDYDYLKYRSSSEYYIVEIENGIENRIIKLCFDIESEYYSRGNLNRRFVVCYSVNNGYEMLNFMFVNK